ncbi:DUF2339 domain-containing protein [uncultured Microscilla sp.]|uniref:DUF2339 domain-containing protein n=1 Tax=uncultured Microscilla sp. TaxID=432653 RepID=UPI00260C9039|nr:DUF2339 domain-containing protein [uncultured Microscilla sp.]
MKQSPEAKIYALEIKIKNMEAQAAVFERDLVVLREELDQLKAATGYSETAAKQALQREFEEEEQEQETPTENPKPIKFPIFDNLPKEEVSPTEGFVENKPSKEETLKPEPIAAFHAADKTKRAATPPKPEKEPFNIENFIGGNVLSKLGILILIIGVGVFLKYAIDRNLISPLGRLILAYTAGAGLIGLSYYLKAKYHAYSAVLFSGGTATVYFTTYIGYVFLQVLPQGVAFPLMLLATVYTVYQSTRFDEEIIGIIGLVGAYAIPPLIGNGGGNAAVFFSYICIINIGVLVLAFRKNWYRVDLTAFVVSWLIFIVWVSHAYNAPLQPIALIFSFAFFITFQVTLVVHYTRQKDQHPEIKRLLLLLNAVVFYMVGTTILQYNNMLFVQNHLLEGYQRMLPGQGLFTLAYSVLCLATGVYVANTNQEGSSSVYLPFMNIGVYMLSFAAYLGFKGVWIPITWAGQATILFTLWLKPALKNSSLEYAIKIIPLGVVLLTPFVLEERATFIAWAIEAAVLFAASRQWQVEAYNAITLLTLTLIALYLPFEFSNAWLLFWWSIEVAVAYSIARIWQDQQYDYLAIGLFVLLAIGIGLIYQDGTIPIAWAIEAAVIFALSRIFSGQSHLYENLSAGLSLLLAYGIFMETEGQARIWWWLLESVVVFALGHFFSSTYLKYVNHLVLMFSIYDTVLLWLVVYLKSSQSIPFVFNHTFFVSISLIAEILGLGYIYNRYTHTNKDQLLEILQYLFDFVGVGLLYLLLFSEITHYYLAQNPTNYHLMIIVLLMYSYAYITALAAAARWWLPLKSFGYGLVFFSVLCVILLVSVGFWHLQALHLNQSYGWLRWGVYALITLMLWAVYRVMCYHQLLTYRQMQLWFIMLHVLAVVTLSFELVALSILYGGLTITQARQSVFKLGFTLVWGIYSVVIIAYGIAKRLKYLRLTGFAFLSITLLKLFANDINYNSTLNVILAFISIGTLLLVTAFLYQKYKHVILAADEEDTKE